MKAYTIGKIFVLLSIPLILLTTNTFAENDEIENLHDETAILVSQERYNDALDIFDQILEIDPNNVKALNHKGAVLIKMDDLEYGLTYFTKALELRPNDIQILKNKAYTLTELKEYSSAISAYETILDIRPTAKWAEEERNYLLLQVDMERATVQSKYFIHVISVVRDSNGNLISVVENTGADFLPTNLTEKFLDKNFMDDGIVIINDIKYKKMVDTRTWIEQEIWCPEVCGAYSYTMLMRVDMLTDVQMIEYFSAFFPAIVVSQGEQITETWTIFKQVD